MTSIFCLELRGLNKGNVLIHRKKEFSKLLEVNPKQFQEALDMWVSKILIGTEMRGRSTELSRSENFYTTKGSKPDEIY